MESEQNYHYFFRTLSNSLRIDILACLKKGEKCVKDISENIGEDRSKISHALKQLLDCNFVSVEKKGRKRIYHLNEDTIQPLLELADRHVTENCDECSLHAKKGF